MKVIEMYRELVVIRSWLDEDDLNTKAKQKLTNLIKEIEYNITFTKVKKEISKL